MSDNVRSVNVTHADVRNRYAEINTMDERE